jgi:hypothetical protein
VKSLPQERKTSLLFLRDSVRKLDMRHHVMVKQLLVTVATLAEAQVAQTVGQEVVAAPGVAQHRLRQLSHRGTAGGGHWRRLRFVLFPIVQHAHVMRLTHVVPEDRAMPQQLLAADVAAEKLFCDITMCIVERNCKNYLRK